MDSTGDADAARVGETLEAGCDVESIAVDLLAVGDHVAEVNADAELRPARRRLLRDFNARLKALKLS
jgi:hypothetical protein